MVASPIHCAGCSLRIRERDDDVVLSKRNRIGTRFYHVHCTHAAERAVFESRGVWKLTYRAAREDDDDDNRKGDAA